MKKKELNLEELDQVTGGAGAGPLSAAVSNMEDNTRLRISPNDPPTPPPTPPIPSPIVPRAITC